MSMKRQERKKETGNRSSDLYFSDEILTAPKGCPVCKGDVKGNDSARYFCENCNILFDRKDITVTPFKKRMSNEARKSLMEKRAELSSFVKKKFMSDAVSAKKESEKAPEPPEKVSENHVEEAEEVEAEIIPPEMAPSIGTERIIDAEENTIDDSLGDDMSEAQEVIQEPAHEHIQRSSEEPAKQEMPAAESQKQEKQHIVASAESTKMHVESCHFIRKIQKENLIFLDSVDDGKAKGYEPCVCIRRLLAKSRA